MYEDTWTPSRHLIQSWNFKIVTRGTLRLDLMTHTQTHMTRLLVGDNTSPLTSQNANMHPMIKR